MVTQTLDNMAAGGIYDQLGNGFHRYSVDRKWLVPHFEKMLYDNAQLIILYLEAYQATKNERYAQISHEIIEYLQREMVGPDGGFYSSQDADSEGKEGTFFVWTPEEINRVLGVEQGKKFTSFFGVTKEGNFENGLSVLSETAELRAALEKKAISREEIDEIIINYSALL